MTERRTSADYIDFPCSRLWREFYAETMDGEDSPSIYPGEGTADLTERMDKLNEKINSIKIPYDVKLLRGELAYLRNKVEQVTTIRKKRKGLAVE